MKVFECIRRIVIFLLGVLCFLKGVFYPEDSLPELIIGMVMVGVLPIENVLNLFMPGRRVRGRHRGQDERPADG